MKKFKVKWYVGCMPYEDIHKEEFCDAVLIETVMEATDIMHVKCLEVLPEDIRNLPLTGLCTRFALYDDKNIVCDYGSHSRFIWIQEMEEL